MYIFFEQYAYDATDANVIKGLQSLVPEWQNIDKRVSVNYVGYFYEPALKDCVFFLPKVLLKEFRQGDGRYAKAYLILDDHGGRVEPEKIITPEGQNRYFKEYPEFQKFLYNFAIWIYRTLAVYKEKNADSEAIYSQTLPQVGNGGRQKINTYLDVILSLIRFSVDNQNFFLFTVKNLHSGLNKINWNKTISKSQAIIQSNNPIYLDPVNKKRQINFDEELFIIFFSILDYINEEYGFRAPICMNYQLLPHQTVENYRKNGIGAIKLRKIKYKYFSDKALQLWELCYAFFDFSNSLYSNVTNREFLLARNYFTVFESMIDTLIGEPHSIIPSGLQDQDDGKVVDHLYVDSVLYNTMESQNAHDVYYIGDSKYYSIGHELTEESIAKQYTYARNVVQWNIDYWSKDEDAKKMEHGDERFKKVRLRNDLEENIVEGYNIIPNFFISAFVNENHEYDDGVNFLPHKRKNSAEDSVHISTHFPNRLFDRDTLILSHYDVNFLYVIKLYAQNKEYEQAEWKCQVRKKFREGVQRVLENKYRFFILKPNKPKEECDAFIRKHFKTILGKLFQPEEYVEEGQYILALEKGLEGDERLIGTLTSAFDVGQCVDENGNTKMDVYPAEFRYGDQFAEYAESDEDNLVIVAYVKDEAQRQWVVNNHWYNVPLEKVNAMPFMMQAKYLLLRLTNECETDCLLPIVKSRYEVWTRDKLVSGKESEPYPHRPSHEAYFMFRVGGNAMLPADVAGRKFRFVDAKYHKSKPNMPIGFVKFEELKKVIDDGV